MDFKVLFSQLVVLYAKLTKQQRIIIATAIMGIVAFLIFMVVYTAKSTSKNKYEVLFDSLSSADAAKVVEQLEKDGIKYELEDNNIIKVPKDVVYKQRIAIAAQGIPKDSGVGFELFDKQEFGATSFDQNIKYMRALEGELSRTINALAPIESASVSLAIPKESLFVEKAVLPTASVMITLVEGRSLSSKQIRGIKNLVASSVTKLSPANVMLVNSDGETLGDEDEMAQMSELSFAQQKYKEKEEKKRQKKIIQVLSPFVGGSEKVVAQVTIEFDFSIKNSTSETFDPENIVRSEQISEEKREGGTPAEVGGVPGTVSNIGPVQGLKSNQTTEKYEKNTGTTNYEIGKTVSTTKSQFARIKRITAAVIVDGKYKAKLDENGASTDQVEYLALDDTDLQAISSLVGNSIGIDEGRGDQISVKNLQFKRKNEVVGPDGVSQALQFSETYLAPFSGLFKYIFVLLLLLILYKKVISPFAERMLEISKEEDDLAKPVLDIEDDAEEDLVEKVQAMRKKVESQLGVGEGFNEDELKHDVLLEKVKNMAEDAPEAIAALLQALLAEEAEVTGMTSRTKG
ncbi:MAG: flagellar basal body M-ring protein FliF [Epsilonproteobacteria bacterium]|nr:flagellar basal body M-ring protein FliF [Campylobacterota bacterium]OIO16151.1 MAG: flagellar M-ring protein FliF [Helicobacteraceae bacterium CG1_02_36_14]PIP10138.1 MAG: flagellar M-ring protein FliF [Sulfurimonas sp. CG23_combo_of_CG06-09_8_20_14_all_36_33]PIS26543.1 MAG: flagellar M-ring protein FliF [Sulfurimonas sp. CG08_land_8_20_14_0_20_36_33]PIU34004.1 MAG: flagellar M-ring protein FliF [Sulfurimonas sp. CG07_land_8_20_14_0_80_36_56]PIV03832.1 MAG: flagellar M-ring protein FliF [S